MVKFIKENSNDRIKLKRLELAWAYSNAKAGPGSVSSPAIAPRARIGGRGGKRKVSWFLKLIGAQQKKREGESISNARPTGVHATPKLARSSIGIDLKDGETITREKRATNPELDAKLFDAVKRLQVEEVKSLIAAGGNSNAKELYNNRHKTLLHQAISYSMLDRKDAHLSEVVACLLDAGADIDGIDGFFKDRTPVFQASYHGLWKLVPYLIERGADTSIRDRDGTTVFGYFYSRYRDGDRGCYEILDILARATDDGRSWLQSAEGQSWSREWKRIQEAERSSIDPRIGVNESPRADIPERQPIPPAATPNPPPLLAASQSIPATPPQPTVPRVPSVAASDQSASFHEAARTRDLATLKAMLKDNPDLVFTKYRDGKTPLHWAAWWGHKDVAELLLANKADVNARADTYGNSPDSGNTPLHTTVSAAASDYSWVKEGHKDVGELLLAHGADVNAENSHGWTPLYRAAGRNSAVAEFLRQHGGQVTTRVTTVEEAVRVGGLEKAKALLRERPGVVFSKDTSGNTPLHWAAKNGYKDVAELLLANAANVNAWGDKGDTPLHWAAFRGHEDVAELFLANGANVDVKNADEWTPLHAAADAGCKGVVTLLLANRADVNAENNARSTPLYRAVVEGHEDVAEILRQHGGHE